MRILERNRKGFTLIELLVVVLIIGILAAVAVPQYKVAVSKARLANLIAMTDAVQKAQEAYYMANGEYTNQWDELGIDFQGTQSQGGKKLSGASGWHLQLSIYPADSGSANAVTATNDKLPGVRLIMAYSKGGLSGTFWDGRRACYASETSSFANMLCKNATHANPWGSGYGNVYYRFR